MLWKWTPMTQVVPAGESGNVKVSHDMVSGHDAQWAAVRGGL